ncbi:XRE family transcriptional regulator [Pseudoflavonifractor sp. 60]|uniref:helix-turn-helix domain-containing protein n=1 Tax=Pseudoflavonifractor sp. 60 TaxID=2304576 RepID=UPI00137049C5|nr:helix-turn-helix transcriptional regulator [Pseudoflavonifractor sp. 60]NBI66267.1 XRE family transcriptional regulator [Pseudoflavonifractor sp. 60]
MVEFLPGTIGQRLAELREQRGFTREELAERVGVSTSTLSRLESGQIQKFSDEVLTALVREFNVSADFLLGLTNIPDRKNYDIEELRLTALAARNLYTGKVNSEVVSRMLEHPRFAMLTTMIAQYFDDTLAAGVAVQNQIFASMGELLLMGCGQRDAAQATALSKIPPYQVELSKIQNTFMVMLKEMKKDMASELAAKQAATKEIVAQMMAELTKGEDRPLTEITPEQMTDAILHTVDTSVFDPDKLSVFRSGVVSLFEALPRAAHEQ